MSLGSAVSVRECLLCSGSGKQGLFGRHKGLGIVGRSCGHCGGTGKIHDSSEDVSTFGGRSPTANDLVPGATVRIHSIRSKVELNGQVAVLQELLDRDKGLWLVKDADGTSMGQIAAKNLELLDRTPRLADRSPRVTDPSSRGAERFTRDPSPRSSVSNRRATVAVDPSSRSSALPVQNGRRATIAVDEPLLFAQSEPSTDPSKEDMAQLVAEPEFTLAQGMRVRVHGVKGRPEMNGLTGVFVRVHEDRCVVRMEEGSKMFFASNLQPVFAPDKALASAAVPPSTPTGRVADPDSEPLLGANSTPPSSPASVPPPGAAPASEASPAETLKGAARGTLNSALQRRPRDARIMRNALKLAERAKLSEEELLPMREALAAEERMAKARSALEEAFTVPIDVEVMKLAIAKGEAAGLEEHELEPARKELQEIPPEAPRRDVEDQAASNGPSYELID